VELVPTQIIPELHASGYLHAGYIS